MKAAGATLRAENPLYPTREVAQSSSQASKGCLKLMPQSWQISSPEIPLQEVLVSSETEQSDKADAGSDHSVVAGALQDRRRRRRRVCRCSGEGGRCGSRGGAG